MKQFETVLERSSDEQLRRIYRLWGMSTEASDLTRPISTHIPTLLTRCSDFTATRFVWDHLSNDEQIVMYRLLTPATRNGVTPSDLRKQTGFSAERFATVSSTLQEYLLMYEEQEKPKKKKGKLPAQLPVLLYPYSTFVTTMYTTGREIFSSTINPTTMHLEQLLNSLRRELLDRIAFQYRLQEEQRYASIPEIAHLITHTLQHPLIIADTVRNMTPEQRELLTWLSKQGGKARISEVRSRASYDDGTLDQLLHTFTEYALTFDGFSKQDQNAWMLFIPSDLEELLKEAVGGERPLLAAQFIMEAPPTVVKASEPFVLYDLAVIINAVYQQIIQPTQDGRVPKRIATKMRPLLQGMGRYDSYNDYDLYIDMLFQMALEMKLLECPPPPLPDIKAAYQPGSGLKTWEHLTEVQQLQQILQYWLNLKQRAWIDLRYWRRAEYGMFDFLDTYSKDRRLARMAIMDYLRKCMPGQWYSVEALLENIWREKPNVLSIPPYANNGRGKKPEHDAWMADDGESFAGLFGSSLYEMGIVDLGYLKKDTQEDDAPNIHPDTFMLTELGMASLAVHRPSTENAVERTLIVQPNFELMLLQIDMPTLYAVLPFVQVKQVGRASRLALTRASVVRGIVNGLTLEQMLERLRSHSQKDIPQNVEYTLNDWTRLYKGARVGQVVLIEVSSEAVADELDTPKYKSLNLRRIGSLALVTTRDINSIRNALDKEGISVTFSAESTASQSTRATASGRYQ